MRKKQRTLKLVILSVVLLILLGIKENKFKAESLSRVSIQLKATNNGVPLNNAVYSAYNLDNAYQRIINGDITEEDTATANWKSLQRQIQPDDSKVNPQVIKFADGLSIGAGIKNSTANAQAVMADILREGGLPVLENLNGGADNNLFHQGERGRMSNYFTDKSGEAVATVPMGLTAIISGNGNFQKLVTISQDNQVVKVDSANIDDRLSLSLETNNRVEKTNFGRYVAESGPNIPLVYDLKISKNFNIFGSIINLNSTVNLVIMSVTAPSDVEGIEITSMDTNGDIAGGIMQQIKIPHLTHDITLKIKAYIMATSTKDIPSKGSGLSVSGIDTLGNNVVAQSPTLLLTGANFVMINSETNELVNGEKYILGKKQGAGYQIYSEQKGWLEVKQVDAVTISHGTPLQGGISTL
ncbi:hypothetical protein [Lactococcus protaetiae]|uniref:Uncharacterized protein n=1 Tax=Lactococcus protaetiae TaxID=2592653 RepID=A0A514Z7F3_9LACT|nr:hypothetical protein [Lactococcus protaetiae]QDK70483.1 hypothetical protein FLP15_03965 [Lactococcus protaetiae]